MKVGLVGQETVLKVEVASLAARAGLGVATQSVQDLPCSPAPDHAIDEGS